VEYTIGGGELVRVWGWSSNGVEMRRRAVESVGLVK
jgi:hypothetical protein